MTSISPIALEVARNQFASIADEMGMVLRRTSYSPNIKERADCSAALFVALAFLAVLFFATVFLIFLSIITLPALLVLLS